MMIVKAGELWIAEITFTDGSASKQRPVLILMGDNRKIDKNNDRKLSDRFNLSPALFLN